MSEILVKTSYALDRGTLGAIDELAKKWAVSKAEALRRAVRQAKEKSDLEAARPTPLAALRWLQEGGGVTLNDAADFKREIQTERSARRMWWEA